jgi:hypothetical protein
VTGTQTPPLALAIIDALTDLADAMDLDGPEDRLAKVHGEVWPEIERSSAELRRRGREALCLAAAEVWHTGVGYRQIAATLGVATSTALGWVNEGRRLPEFVERHGEPSDARAQARGIRDTPRVRGKLAPRSSAS